MSRRGSVLENYKVPDLTNPINPIDAQRMVSEERIRGQELEQTKKTQKVKAQADRDKGVDDGIKELDENKYGVGTIYTPVGRQAIRDLKTDMEKFAKENPSMPYSEIKSNPQFLKRTNDILQYFDKEKTIFNNTKTFNDELGKSDDKGFITEQLPYDAVAEALIDPETGKIRTDVSTVNALENWGAKVIEKNPSKYTNKQGLYDFVNDTKNIGDNKVEVKDYDSKGGFVKDKLLLKTPPYMEIARNSNGKPIKDKNGNYTLVPKHTEIPPSKELPNGVRFLDDNLFNDIKKNKSSYYKGLMAEVANYIKTNNDESDDNIALDSVEAENIAKMFAYEDVKTVWGNKGISKVYEDKPPQIKNITNINTGSGNNTQALYNDTWGRIKNKYTEIQKEKIDSLNSSNPNDPRIKQIENNNFVVSMQNLDTEAINLISKQVNEGRAADKQISPDDMYVNFTTNGEIKVYKAKKTANGKEGVIDKDYLIATLPPSSNLKAPQANTKSKVSAQEEARQREEEIKNGEGKKVYKIGNKEFTEEQLQKGADKNKMSLADYKKSIGL